MLIKNWCSFKFLQNLSINFEFEENFNNPLLFKFLMKVILIDFYQKKKKGLLCKKIEIFYWFFYKKFPQNFNFEIKKTIDYLKKVKKASLFLQFPDGLEYFSSLMVNTLDSGSRGIEEIWVGSRITYGACCIEDYLAKSISANFTIHYGHSCLVPLVESLVLIFFVFLEIKFDFSLINNILKEYFPKKQINLSILSTIQFVSSLKNLKNGNLKNQSFFFIPQIKPLSPGEILGCTSPYVESLINIFYIGDGRFHLESIMLANLFSRFLQFNPFSQILNLIGYKTVEILQERKFQILKSIFNPRKMGLLNGSIGRQGNLEISKKLEEILDIRSCQNLHFKTSEISLDKLRILNEENLDILTQIACPRLSIDWGISLVKPLLTPYETGILLRFALWKNFFYPMDYYSKKSPFWSNYSIKKSDYKPFFFFQKLKQNFYFFFSVSHF